MKVIARLNTILPVQMGENDRGTWYRGCCICESLDGEGRMMAFVVMGKNRTEQLQQIPIGSTVEVNFVIESRPYGDRWFTDARANTIDVLTSSRPSTPVNNVTEEN